jgi:hypothetical protein
MKIALSLPTSLPTKYCLKSGGRRVRCNRRDEFVESTVYPLPIEISQ